MRRPSLTLNRNVAALALTALVAIAAAFGAAALAGPGVTLELRAPATGELVFQPATLEAPATTRVSVIFRNDSTMDHNLVFVGELSARSKQLVTPGDSDRIDFSTPQPGTYRFVCTVHEGMEGMLVVR